MRLKHLQFIADDTKKRGETIVSDIRFLGMIYHLKVKTKKSKRAKTVKYSAAQNVMNGYRAIKV